MFDDIESAAAYDELLDSIKRTLSSARLRAARTVNNILIDTYWQIGRDILERRRKHGWGARVTDRLSADLRTAHPEMRGLSSRNLRYMATMAAAWPEGIGQHAAAQLPWGHVMVLLDTCEDPLTRDFYAQRAADQGWTRKVLETMIASRLHEREQAQLTTFDRTVPETERESVRELVKDPYVLDFVSQAAHERDLRRALIANLTTFLRELGAGFAFVGAEHPIPCGNREFFVDLLFYHYRLHRFVVFEIKTEQFEPEYIGKLNFYVQLIDDQLRQDKHDDPTVGILLVVGRDDITVEVALRGIGTPLAVSELRMLPEEVRRELPSAADLSRAVAETVKEVEQGPDAGAGDDYSCTTIRARGGGGGR
jgi:predicted nuclease of restriction endonuclease-like (RecB) superfamily